MSYISRGILFLTALCLDLLFNQKWKQVPLPDHRLLVLKCRGLWCMAECHLCREELSSPLPLYLHLVSVRYHIFSWPRSWLPEKRIMGIRENSCLASPWNLEGGYSPTATQAVHRELHRGLRSPPDPLWCNSAKLWSLLPFLKCSSVWGKLWVWRELRSPAGTQKLQSHIPRLKPGCQRDWLSPAAPFGHCRFRGDPQCSQPQIPPWQVSPLQATVPPAGCKAGGFTFSIVCCSLNYLLQSCWWSTQVVLLCIVSRCLQTHPQGQILIVAASAKYSPLDWGPILCSCWTVQPSTLLA